jgi:hypothetical protein
MSRSSLPPLFSALAAQAFGILMVVTAVRPSGPIGLAALGLSALALLAGLFVRQAAPAAVVVSIAAMGLADPTPVFAAVSGLSAAAYLLLRYAESDGGPGSDAVTLTVPTAVGLVGFTLAALAASAIGTQLAWVPLLAPLIAMAILILVALPLWADERTGALLADEHTAAAPAPAPEPPA